MKHIAQPTSLESLIADLDRDTLDALWMELGLSQSCGASRGRHSATLAREIVGFFDIETLAKKPVRDALLHHYHGKASKLLKQRPSVSRRFNDWPTLLIPAWKRGGLWARRFCAAFDIDSAYAGEAATERTPTVEELETRTPLKPLKDFQEDLRNQIVEAVLDPEPCRIMASLPTGAGKTRVAINAILRSQAKLGGVVLWIATTSEVCEQAALTYKHEYEEFAPLFGGHLHRFWASHALSEDFLYGFMVGGIRKLSSLDFAGPAARQLRDSVSLVVFDEAHHAVARTYRKTLEFFAGTPRKPRVPLVGLTATPGRGIDPDGSQIRALVAQFGARLLVPTSLRGRNPIRALQLEGILSKVDRVTRRGVEDCVSEEERSHIESLASFPPSVLRRVGADADRNRLILEQVTRDQTRQKTLVFACDVTQADYLAYQWRSRNVDARSITATTHASLRRKWINEFTHGNLRVLVNVGVLTAGFDAPIVRRLIMGRPTVSPILFEQMVGRGLRGSAFGGTDLCTVVDIVDSFVFHGEPRGFQKFEREWMKGKRAD